MAISLTTDGLNLDYRADLQTSVSGTYPIGTVIGIGYIGALTFPGTWLFLVKKPNGTAPPNSRAKYGAKVSKAIFGIRVA